jgi:hypothetical protein
MDVETITVFGGCIEDVSPAATPGQLEITISDVDVSQLVQEVGIDLILSEIKEEDIVQYLKDKKEREEEDDE